MFIFISGGTQKASEWRNKVANINKPESIFNTVEREWVLKMAKQGHLKAQCRLADFYESLACYDDAFEVEKFKWLKKVAEGENLDAQNELAGCYLRGEGIEKDILKALEWLKKAAVNGSGEAQYELSSRQALLYRRKEKGERLNTKALFMVPDTFEETGFPEFEKELFNFINAKRLGNG